MNVSLSEEIARFVEEKVNTGAYASADDLIEEALRKFRASSRSGQIEGVELEKLIAVGQEDADAGRLIDGDHAFEQRRQRRAAGRNREA